MTTEVFINKNFIGNIEDQKEFCNQIREERRAGKIDESVNIYYNEDSNQIHINSYRGRARQPDGLGT